MYIPGVFREPDLAVLHAFIEQHSFGPAHLAKFWWAVIANHLPFFLDRSSGEKGALLGHMARANPQWQELSGGNCLTIFSGPHSYVSPTWYEAENMVPTWNYVAVHAYGTVEIVEDHESLLSILKCSVDMFEQSMPKPWSFEPSGNLHGEDAQADRWIPNRYCSARGKMEVESKSSRRATDKGCPCVAIARR